MAALVMPAAAVYPGFYALITHEDTGGISIVDLSSDPPRETLIYDCCPEDKTSMAVVSQDRDCILVGLPGVGKVLGLNISGDSPKQLFKIPVGGRPAGIAISPDSRTALIGNSELQSVAIVNISRDSDHMPVFIPTDQVSPMAVGFTSDGRYGLITAGSTNGTLSILSLDGPEPTVQYTIPVGASPRAMAVDPTGKRIVVTLSGERKPFYVSVINSSTEPFTVITRIPIGDFPPGIPQISPDGKTALIPLTGSYVVAAIDLGNETPELTGMIPVGKNPGTVAFTPDSSVAFITTRGGSSLAEVDLSELEVIKQNILQYFAPYGIALYIQPGKHIPVIYPVQPCEVEVGKMLAFTLEVTDADGDSLTTTAVNLPPGAVFNGTAFSWIPLLNQTGSFNPVFSVTDGVYSSQQAVNITVVGNGLNGLEIPPPPAVPGM